ncbi:hypothetical protein PGT21_029597 [Puccinia graminis f. sp. tritici]|uniref:Uncharacterized protein n=1 Tax=Puccinia graminis f. sp. tritici TaxID=56615 RepID=A0A5B0PAT5_PUCGR|nr:hypothetical protein PGT21_029597 [Puccinia graminis f. sp. tritici]
MGSSTATFNHVKIMYGTYIHTAEVQRFGSQARLACTRRTAAAARVYSGSADDPQNGLRLNGSVGGAHIRTPDQTSRNNILFRPVVVDSPELPTPTPLQPSSASLPPKPYILYDAPSPSIRHSLRPTAPPRRVLSRGGMSGVCWMKTVRPAAGI